MSTQDNPLPEILDTDTNAGVQQTPGVQEEIQPFLNHVQQNYIINQGGTNVDTNFESTGIPATTTTTTNTNAQNADASATDITNLGPAPTPPNLLNTYQQLRKDYNISDIESDIMQLRSDAANVAARLRARTTLEKGKSVPMNVIAGRTNEAGMQEQENMDFINRQLDTKTMQLNSANSIVSTIMSLTGQDYANASAWFNNEFSRRMQIHSMYEADADRDATIAKSQLEVIMEMIENGALDYNNATPEQKLAWGKLEVAAGYEPGFLAGIKMTPGANVVTTSSRVGGDGYNYVDIVTRNPDGSYKVESVRMGQATRSGGGGGGGSGGGGASVTQTQINTGKSILTDLGIKAGGSMTPEQYQDFVDRLGGNTDIANATLQQMGITKGAGDTTTQASKGQKAVGIANINASLTSGDQDLIYRTLNQWQDIVGRDSPYVKDAWLQWNRMTGRIK